MKKHSLKRLLAFILVLCMAFGTVGNVYAAEEDSDEESILTWEKVEGGNLASDSGRKTEVVHNTTENQYADDENVRVFIVLSGDSVMKAGYPAVTLAENEEALNYSDMLEKEQEAVIEQISQGVLDGAELDVNYSFTVITNAVSATVKYGQIDAIKNVDGVSAVYLVPVYELADAANPNTVTSGDMVGSYQTWANGYTGAGSRIAVIDTGLDSDHPSFNADAFLTSLKEAADKADKTVADYDLLDAEEISGVLERLNAFARYKDLTAESLYLNEKVPFGFNYVDADLNITHDYDTQGDHGTHVSGIATANKYVPVVSADSSVAYERQAEGVVGIAPDAQLIVMKVFGVDGGAYSDDYMAAIEDAILLGADAINLSLGAGNPGFTYEGDEYVDGIFEGLLGSDVVVSISAGNSYSWGKFGYFGRNTILDVSLDTVGSPGSFENALTVASVNNSGYTGYAAGFENNNLIFYNETTQGSSGEVYSNVPLVTLDTSGKGTEYEYVLIDGVGEEADYEGLDVQGKVVLVYRGTTSFYQKHDVAGQMGAKALFVINNTDGVINMDLSSSSATIPCVSILQAEGESIKAGATEKTVGDATIYTGTVTIYSSMMTNYNVADGYTMSEFSSWGVPGDLSLKPEITAPGGNIYSTLNNGTYGQMSGTSMAAPSVTGMSAVVLQYIRENDLVAKTGLSSRTLAQSLLMSTAVPLMEGEVEYSPRRQGAGLANVEAATTSPSYILVGEKEGNDGKVKVELGDDPARTGVYSFNFTLYNMSDEQQAYEFDSSILTEAVINDMFLAETEYPLAPDVAFDLSQLGKTLTYDFDQDGDVDVDDADAMISWINQTETTALTDNQLVAFDFDADGDYDSNDAYLYLCYIVGAKTEVNVKDKEAYTIPAGGQATVGVTVTLSDADRAYLEQFVNGIYIDGYIYVDSTVDMSVPMLAFYGNWSDSYMFENFDYMSKSGYLYSDVGMTNFLSFYEAGSTDELTYEPNMQLTELTDDEYISDRNAISSVSGDRIGAIYYTLIRNAGWMAAEVIDLDTGEVYYGQELGENYSEFYYVNGQYWNNTLNGVDLNWSGTDAEGNPLPDGTRTAVCLVAFPEYYLKNPDAELGNGVMLGIPVAIDNTAPEATEIAAVVKDSEFTGLNVTVNDNRYVAAVQLRNSAGQLLQEYAVNQTNLATETTVNMDISLIDRDVVYVVVIDYAGNETDYRVKISYKPDTTVAENVEITPDSVRVLKGTTYALSATVYPEDLLTVPGVTWTSADESIATVDENGVVTGVSLGTTTITATTVAEPKLTATCTVEVFELSVDLNGIVWENGETSGYMSTFNTSALDSYSKLSDQLAQNLFSATVVGDKLYAATYTVEGRTGYSDIYVVDPNNGYSADLVTSKTNWMTDMTYLPSCGMIAGSFGYYLRLYDPETNTVFGAFDLKEELGSDYIIGVAYEGTVFNERYQNYVDYLFAVTQSGVIYEIGVMPYQGDYGMFGPGLVGSFGYTTNSLWFFNSLYYDFESNCLFWSAIDDTNFFSGSFGEGGQGTLFSVVFDEEGNGQICNLGQFPEGMMAMTGLYSSSDFANAGTQTTGVINSAEKAKAEAMKFVSPDELAAADLAAEIPVE